MKKILIGLACAMALSAQAQNMIPGQAASPYGIRFLGALGVTFGGDNLGKVIFTNGKSESIHAGGTVDFRGGLEYRLTGQPLAIEFSLGYHFDKVAAKNGDATFSRLPIDLVLHYSFNPSWRMGFGLRHSMSAELKVDFDKSASDKFTSNTAPLIELEYFVSPELAFKARYATQEYKSKKFGDTVKGDHFGIYGSVYF